MCCGLARDRLRQCTGGELFDRITAMGQYKVCVLLLCLLPCSPIDGVCNVQESDAARVLRQLFKAIDYMHRKKKVLNTEPTEYGLFNKPRALTHTQNTRTQVCHNDLKPDNALFLSEDPDAPLKIIDFGRRLSSPVGGSACAHGVLVSFRNGQAARPARETDQVRGHP